MRTVVADAAHKAWQVVVFRSSRIELQACGCPEGADVITWVVLLRSIPSPGREVGVDQPGELLRQRVIIEALRLECRLAEVGHKRVRGAEQLLQRCHRLGAVEVQLHARPRAFSNRVGGAAGVVWGCVCGVVCVGAYVLPAPTPCRG